MVSPLEKNKNKKNKNKNKKPKWRFFTSRGAHLNCAMLYTHSIGNQPRTRWWCLKCVIVYLARDILPFVMYCVNGKPRSSLLIESTDSMILLMHLSMTCPTPTPCGQRWGYSGDLPHSGGNVPTPGANLLGESPHIFRARGGKAKYTPGTQD